VEVDREDLVDRDDGVVVEDALRGGAGAHRDGPLGFEHLVVDAADDRGHLDRQPARDDQQVGLAGGGAEGLEAEARDVDARADHGHHLDRAAGQPEGGGHEGVAAGPVGRALHRGGEDGLLDVLVERVPLEVAAQHVAGAQLASPEVGDLRRLLAADYLHSSAPRRQT
jgi:hypothetical protein